MPRCHRTCVRTSRRSLTIYGLAPDMLSMEAKRGGVGEVAEPAGGAARMDSEGTDQDEAQGHYPVVAVFKGHSAGIS